jgi:hypothetical protein
MVIRYFGIPEMPPLRAIERRRFGGILKSPEGAASANDGFSPSDKKKKTKISPERVVYTIIKLIMIDMSYIDIVLKIY